MNENQIEKIDLDKIDWRSSREFFESLGEALDRLDDKDEKYDFTWVGKRKAIIEAGAPINKTFRPNIEASKNWDTTENLFIEGDNLDALKLLQESYLGKVKMIYIDPPYNTGQDFVYHDNFKVDVAEYDDATDYKDEDGNIQFKKNEKSNGRYHSDWLSMMYPRLKLARNLLKNNGVIFISIDDNEQANLKKLCDEVLGDDNFVAQFVWKRRQATDSRNQTNISGDHEYILVYSKSNKFISAGVGIDESKYSNPDNDPRGPWASVDLTVNATRDQRPNQYYDIVDPETGISYPANPRRIWSKSKAVIEQMIIEGRILFPANNKMRPREKKFLADLKRGNTGFSTWIDPAMSGQTTHGTREMAEIFQDKIFDFPKSTKLMRVLAEQGMGKDDIVLDFFSGSGTVAHAIMQMNAEDGGSRKWIMVQLPEETNKNSDAYKVGYKTIPDISRERIRRAGEKIAKEHPEAKVDYGFRALTIADTNYREVYRSAGELQQSAILDLIDNVKDDRSDIDLLYGVLTQSALELNRPIAKREIAGSDVFLYDYFGEVSGLVSCFSKQVSENTIKEIAKLKPLTAVFRDSTFADSQAKVNLSEHFRVLSPETKVKVI